MPLAEAPLGRRRRRAAPISIDNEVRVELMGQQCTAAGGSFLLAAVSGGCAGGDRGGLGAQLRRTYAQGLTDASKGCRELVLGGANERTTNSLNGLFRNLSVVRNQIVHGASAGSQSHGRTQVRLRASLLDRLIPCFRDSIQSNLDEDWGSPPFPRVGAGPDDECPPPWLKSAGPRSGPVREDQRGPARDPQ